MTYQRYADDCKKLGHKPTLTQKQFNECTGVKEDLSKPLQIRPKINSRKVDATHENYKTHISH
jgi:hypothetical protein